MLELIATLILLSICMQLMAIVDSHKRFEKLERNVAEIINNELKVYKLKHNGIELKNIDLSNISMTEQWDKVAEEDIEFEESDDIFEMISEFWDTVQARLGILQKLGVDAKIVMKYYPEHLKKLENRPRTKEIE
ncbi:MAG: hypothetical protein SO128_06540 [Clostridium cadaveris]|uniref:hypothetical protein n=1 Tax=Clostridium cadaveris TaxID=1529 RepID=UPI002A8E4D3C|nr:hypothetical protein [Clostridium cadaveris]